MVIVFQLEVLGQAFIKIGVPIQRINEIVRGKRGVTPETAWLLSEALSTTPEFWLNLQSTHDLSANRPQKHIEPLVAVGM